MTLFGEYAACLFQFPFAAGVAETRTQIAGASRPIPQISGGGCPCRTADLKAVFGQRHFAPEVTFVHATDLRHGHVRFRPRIRSHCQG